MFSQTKANRIHFENKFTSYIPPLAGSCKGHA